VAAPAAGRGPAGVSWAAMSRFRVGDDVQTPHGKGVVRAVRNGGRVLVHVQQRAVVVAEDAVTPLQAPAKTPRRAPAPPAHAATGSSRELPVEVDLHGLTVEEATTRIDAALDAALRAGAAQLRFIHGRSGGRLRGALHARLRQIAAVDGFRLDPRNPGVTIVSF
jgi:dsDNA-specific endonuclease/ATPase MutS2